MAYKESAVAPQPGERAFDLPAATIAAELASVLSRATDSATTMRADQIPTARAQLMTQCVAVVGSIGDDGDYPLRFRSADFVERPAGERDFRGAG